MRNIKDILKASACSFYENIYEYYSLDVDKFLENLNSFLLELDLQSRLDTSNVGLIYDIKNIDNICNNTKFRRDSFEYDQIVDGCRAAYLHTLKCAKTINIESFVDNLAKEFTANT